MSQPVAREAGGPWKPAIASFLLMGVLAFAGHAFATPGTQFVQAGIGGGFAYWFCWYVMRKKNHNDE